MVLHKPLWALASWYTYPKAHSTAVIAAPALTQVRTGAPTCTTTFLVHLTPWTLDRWGKRRRRDSLDYQSLIKTSGITVLLGRPTTWTLACLWINQASPTGAIKDLWSLNILQVGDRIVNVPEETVTVTITTLHWHGPFQPHQWWLWWLRWMHKQIKWNQRWAVDDQTFLWHSNTSHTLFRISTAINILHLHLDSSLPTYGRRCCCATGLRHPPEHSDERRQRGWCSDRPFVRRSHRPRPDRDGNRAPSLPHHGTPAEVEIEVQVWTNDWMNSCLRGQDSSYQATWKTELCMMEHTDCAYCLLWVYVAQGSGGTTLGTVQRSVVNFPAKDDTLFSTSPSGVIKSSCWFQVSVPHRPRTLNTHYKPSLSVIHFVYSLLQQHYYEVHILRFTLFLLGAHNGSSASEPCEMYRSPCLQSQVAAWWVLRVLLGTKVAGLQMPGWGEMKRRPCAQPGPLSPQATPPSDHSKSLCLEATILAVSIQNDEGDHRVDWPTHQRLWWWLWCGAPWRTSLSDNPNLVLLYTPHSARSPPASCQQSPTRTQSISPGRSGCHEAQMHALFLQCSCVH